MISIGENRSTRRKTCPGVTLSKINPASYMSWARTGVSATRSRQEIAYVMSWPVYIVEFLSADLLGNARSLFRSPLFAVTTAQPPNVLTLLYATNCKKYLPNKVCAMANLISEGGFYC